MTIKVPPSKDVVQRMLIQWTCIIIIGLLFCYFHFIRKDTRQRGFFCDDQTLMHPYMEVGNPGSPKNLLSKCRKKLFQ